MDKVKKADGRPKKFTPQEFKQAWEDYFKWVEENPWYKKEALKSGDRAGEIINVPTQRPYTEDGFCVFHNVSRRYLYQLEKSVKDKVDADSKLYDEILSIARTKCRCQKFEGATVGVFNQNIIARDLGLVDKQSHVLTPQSIDNMSDEQLDRILARFMNNDDAEKQD